MYKYSFHVNSLFYPFYVFSVYYLFCHTNFIRINDISYICFDIYAALCLVYNFKRVGSSPKK